MKNKKQLIITIEGDTISFETTNLTQIEIIGVLHHFKERVSLDMLVKNDEKQVTNKQK